MNIKDFYLGKRILITGHTGFKGSWLCSLFLELNAKVCGVGLAPITNPNLFEQLNLEKKIESHNIADIRDLKKLKEIFDEFKPEIVFHLAAQPLVIESYQNPVYTYDVNVMGTVNVCECVRLSKSVQSFVNITTDKVYENIEDINYAYIETDKLNGYDPYSNSKSCSEIVTDSYRKSFFSLIKIPVSTCRAGNVIGGGDYSINRIIPDCIRAAKKNEHIILRNPDSIRPYQHVLEAIFFYANLAMKQVECDKLQGAYNVGPFDKDVKSTKELCEIFCAHWGNSMTWQCSEKFTEQHESNFLKLNINKSQEKLLWVPKLTVEKAIDLTIEFEKSTFKESIIKSQIQSYLEMNEKSI